MTDSADRTDRFQLTRNFFFFIKKSITLFNYNFILSNLLILS